MDDFDKIDLSIGDSLPFLTGDNSEFEARVTPTQPGECPTGSCGGSSCGSTTCPGVGTTCAQC
jgi:hypothetical protein